MSHPEVIRIELPVEFCQCIQKYVRKDPHLASEDELVANAVRWWLNTVKWYLEHPA